jgi:hypothetical protein
MKIFAALIMAIFAQDATLVQNQGQNFTREPEIYEQQIEQVTNQVPQVSNQGADEDTKADAEEGVA